MKPIEKTWYFGDVQGQTLYLLCDVDLEMNKYTFSLVYDDGTKVAESSGDVREEPTFVYRECIKNYEESVLEPGYSDRKDNLYFSAEADLWSLANARYYEVVEFVNNAFASDFQESRKRNLRQRKSHNIR